MRTNGCRLRSANSKGPKEEKWRTKVCVGGLSSVKPTRSSSSSSKRTPPWAGGAMTKREAAVTFLLSLIFSVLVAASCSLIADDARGGIPAGMVHTDKPTASSATSTKKGGGGGHGGGASGGGRGGTGGNGVHGPRTPGAGIVVVGGVGASHGRKHSGGSRSRGNCLAAPVVVAVALGFTVTLAFV